MVDVGVRDEDAEQRLGLHGKGLVFKAVRALFHAAIDEEGAIVDGKQCLAAGDFMGGAEKFHAHVFTLLFFIIAAFRGAGKAGFYLFALFTAPGTCYNLTNDTLAGDALCSSSTGSETCPW